MRYLNLSELVAVRYLAAEKLRRRRPRRASRVRSYVAGPSGTLFPLGLSVYGVPALRGAA